MALAGRCGAVCAGAGALLLWYRPPVLAASLLLLCCASPQGGEADRPNGLTVVVVDVGQGDGIIVRAPDGRVHVIDGGPPGQGTASVLPVLDSLQPTGYGFTFLSHYHDDHQGGLDEVLGRAFSFAYDRGDLRRTATGSGITNYLAAAGARRATIVVGGVYQLGGGAAVRCIAVDGHVQGGAFVDPVTSAQEENSRSIALRLDYGQFSMWLGGDLTGGGNGTADVEGPASLACGDVDVYKLNHHGSNTSTSTNLVARLQPELAVVSCGVGNSYGHPTTTVVNRLNQAAAARALLSTTTGSLNTIGFGVTGHLRIDTDGTRYRATAQNGDFLDFYCDEVVLPALAAGSVRISEIQRNPNIVPDTNGEYVEVQNVGPRPVSLRGLQIADGSSTVTIASNFALLPGRPLVFQTDGAPSRNGGQPLGVALPYNTLVLGDTADTVALSQNGVAVDAVAYTSAWPGGAGTAAERRDLLAAHTAANYAAATLAYGAGDRGTPGRRNVSDSTLHAVQVAVASDAQGFTLHGTAIGHGGRWSAFGIAYGQSPGFPLFGAIVPLNQDPLLLTFLGLPGAITPLPDEGYRSLRVAMPSPNPLAGVPLYAAHVILDLQTMTVPGLSSAFPFVLP
jgi:beta-lactamase superfamily II metal-dependent hydrolase